MTAARRRSLILIPVGLVALAGATIGVGWLVTHQFAHDWPFTAEDGVDRALARHRTPVLNQITGFLSTMANTTCAIVLTVAFALVARLVFARWREALFLAGSVAAASAVFLTTTLAIDRPRPAVLRLDAAPPTSSFPSGHSAAALALYSGIILLARRRGAPWPVWLLALIPVAVGASRLYRGMHHPSDVVAGLLVGASALALMRWSVLEPPTLRLAGSCQRP